MQKKGGDSVQVFVSTYRIVRSFASCTFAASCSFASVLFSASHVCLNDV